MELDLEFVVLYFALGFTAFAQCTANRTRSYFTSPHSKFVVFASTTVTIEFRIQ